MGQEMNTDITIIIKTFERPDLLLRLIESIRNHYDSIPIIIVDDSKKTTDLSSYKNITYLRAPFDTGISFGRNLALQYTKTKFFVLCDDDHIFTNNTNLTLFKELLVRHHLDILGGKVLENGKQNKFEYFLSIKNNILVYDNRKKIMLDNQVYKYDLVHNFFIANTDKIKYFGAWDVDLPLNEHTEFFLRIKNKKGNVAFTPNVSIVHDPKKTPHYNRFRERDYFDVFMKKYGIEKVVKKENGGIFIKIKNKIKVIYKRRMLFIKGF